MLVDLPEPLCPVIIHFSPAFTLSEKSFKIGDAFSYPKHTCRKATLLICEISIVRSLPAGACSNNDSSFFATGSVLKYSCKYAETAIIGYESWSIRPTAIKKSPAEITNYYIIFEVFPFLYDIGLVFLQIFHN